MNIDRGTFLLLVGTLAVGGASGYLAAEKRIFPSIDKWRGRPPEVVVVPVAEPTRTAVAVEDAAPPVSASPPPTAPAVAAPAAPACDDSVATVGACPPPGLPTDEGGCGSFANLRCAELKQAMKPKVAAAAVTCLNGLKPSERCDPARVYLCGHLALMNACPEGDPAHSVGAHDAGAGAAGTGAVAAPGGKTDGGALASNVGDLCQTIIAGCGASPVAPSMTECRQLLSGMTEVGRERTRTCMKAHCFDRGLVGCEGVVVAK